MNREKNNPRRQLCGVISAVRNQAGVINVLIVSLSGQQIIFVILVDSVFNMARHFALIVKKY
jgi:hypothetical protein